MDITYYTPEHPEVRKIIDRYIILSSHEDQLSYTCFPNSNHCLGVIRHKEISDYSNRCIHFKDATANSHYISGIYTKPLQINVEGLYMEICIDFKPLAFQALGLPNQFHSTFIHEPLKAQRHQLLKGLYHIINEFDTKQANQYIQALDGLFYSAIKTSPSSEFNVLNENDIRDIASLKLLLNKSERSVHRFFKDNLAITPYKYLEVIKLQRCLKGFVHNKDLTSLIHDNDLVDHSHLNKFIKKYTYSLPSILRSELSSHRDFVFQQ